MRAFFVAYPRPPDGRRGSSCRGLADRVVQLVALCRHSRGGVVPCALAAGHCPARLMVGGVRRVLAVLIASPRAAGRAATRRDGVRWVTGGARGAAGPLRWGGMGLNFIAFSAANLAPASVYTRGTFFKKAKMGRFITINIHRGYRRPNGVESPPPQIIRIRR